MNLKLTFLFVISLCLAQSQNLSISGRVLDANGQALAFATLSFQKNQTATSTNFEGNFKLVYAQNSLPDSLVVRHIAFETQKIYLDTESAFLLKEIKLKEKVNEVNLIEIRANTALQIIEKVINAIPENYANGYFFVDGFYRQAHKENNRYVRLIECFAQVKEDVSNRNSNAQKESYNVSTLRRSNVYERNGAQHGDHLVDLFLEDPINYSHSSFLNEQAYNLYDFSFDRAEKETLIKINFQNKAWTNSENKSGYVLINRADFALVEMEITSTPNALDKSYNKSNWKFQNGTYKVQYEKFEEKYYCSRSSKYYNHYVLNDRTKNVEYIVEEYFDWFSYLINGTQESITNQYKLKPLTNLYSLDYKYDPILWREAPTLNQKIKDDLNSFMSLEKQFEDD